MKTSTSITSTKIHSPIRSNTFAHFARTLMRKKLKNLETSTIAIHDEDGVWSSDKNLPADISIQVHDLRFYTDVLIAGSNGAASAYRDGYWSCNNLCKLFRIMQKNQQNTDAINSGFAALGNWWLTRRHKERSNTKEGSKNNIHAHYDLGNEMFELFLDPSMTYSSGIFLEEQSTLEQASFEKLDRICRKLDLKPEHKLVEIGTGWGSFAIHAAKHYGCHVTTTTISQQQFDMASERIQAAGLQDRIDIKLEDYRNLQGQFDKLVSIEMIEAVGNEFLPEYFGKCSSLLKQDGQMVIQAITMPDNRYEGYLKNSDFIQQFIFPGSCVPSLTAMMNAVSVASDLKVNHIEDFAIDYAKTLRAWLDNFMRKLDQVKQLGYTDDFIRLWEYYLCYCEAGFRERHTGVMQIHFNKPGYDIDTLQ